MATGATISTVATLSTKAEMIAANTDRLMMAHLTLGTRLMMRSARRAGMRDSMNSATVPMVPAIIMITFQSTAEKTSPGGMMPSATKSAAEPSAMKAR